MFPPTPLVEKSLLQMLWWTAKIEYGPMLRDVRQWYFIDKILNEQAKPILKA